MAVSKYLNPAHYARFVGRRLYFTKYNSTRARVLAQLMSAQATNQAMTEFIRSPEPALIGRMGGTETVVCWHYLQRAAFILRINLPYDDHMRMNASIQAGITPNDDKSLDLFSSTYLASIQHADVMGVWDARGMYEIVDRLGAIGLKYTGLASLEPWDSLGLGQIPWTQALAGKSVLVVHPFAASIEAQYARRRKIKTISSILPDMNLSTLVPPVTFAGSENGRSWQDNYRDLCAKVGRIPFDVAIIGCGAYGLPLGAFVKQMGRKAVHLGGATQLLFGIRGKRWDDYANFAHLMDETWVRPMPAETPQGAQKVEEACYW